ncbi:MAG: transporter component [Clostridia bacterium]|jgi:hypothetical protein|nr:transporter component [Clostridia bacterium]
MKNNSTRSITLSGILIALGLILPIATHGIGSGSILLPMHIPVLLAGFILPLPYAVFVGGIIPVLSSVLTGMPPVFPVLIFMFFELIAYAAATHLLYVRFKQNVYVSLIGGMVVGRIVSAIVVWILASFFMAKLPSPVIFITGGIVEGLPGLLIQLVLIPAIIYALKKVRLI